MIILLTLLSLCATDCRVHRADSIATYNGWVITDCRGLTSRCENPSHWLPCVVVEKCDTTVVWEATAGKFLNVDCDSVGMKVLNIRCHPDTLVDSGVRIISSAIRSGTEYVAGSRTIAPDGYISKGGYNLQPPIDSAELADIRAMLREWRVEKCFQKARDWAAKDQMLMLFQWEIDAVRDSCECAVEGVKK